MNSCDLLKPDLGWEAGVVSTLQSRRFHTSSQTGQGLLLIGGDDSPETSELLPWGTNQSIPSVSLPPPGRLRHCSIQISEDVVVLTGGSLPQTSNLVTELSNLGSSWQVSRQSAQAAFWSSSSYAVKARRTSLKHSLEYKTRLQRRDEERERI